MKGVRNVRTRIQSTVAGAAIVLAVMLFGAAAEARTCVPTRPALHVESVLRTLGPAPAVEGFVSNEEILRLSNVRLRVDVVDVARVATEEAFGWIFGDLAPRRARILRRVYREMRSGLPSECRVVRRGLTRWRDRGTNRPCRRWHR